MFHTDFGQYTDRKALKIYKVVSVTLMTQFELMFDVARKYIVTQCCLFFEHALYGTLRPIIYQYPKNIANLKNLHHENKRFNELAIDLLALSELDHSQPISHIPQTPVSFDVFTCQFVTLFMLRVARVSWLSIFFFLLRLLPR